MRMPSRLKNMKSCRIVSINLRPDWPIMKKKMSLVHLKVNNSNKIAQLKNKSQRFQHLK